VAATLGEALVLEVDAGHPGLYELLHRTHGRERIAVTVVGVGNDGRLYRARHHGRRLGHLGHGQETHVRPAVQHGDGVTTQVDGLHPGALGNLCIERGVDAAGEEVRLVAKELPGRLALALHAVSSPELPGRPRSPG